MLRLRNPAHDAVHELREFQRGQECRVGSFAFACLGFSTHPEELFQIFPSHVVANRATAETYLIIGRDRWHLCKPSWLSDDIDYRETKRRFLSYIRARLLD